MSKRVSIITFIATFVLMFACSTASVLAADIMDEQGFFDTALLITEDDIEKGVYLEDKPLRLIPKENIDITLVVQDQFMKPGDILEKVGEHEWNYAQRDAHYLFYPLQAGVEYCMFKSSFGTSKQPAQIKKVEYINLTLDANGGTYSGEKVKSLNVPEGYGISSEVEKPEREGYVFWKYNTKPDGTGLDIGQYPNFTRDTTFYAIWRKYYKVTIFANGGYFRGEVNPDINDYNKTDHVTITIPEGLPGTGVHIDYGYIDGSVDCTWEPKEYSFYAEKDGFRVKCWNTKPDGTGKTYDESTPVTSDITVYVMWTCRDNHAFNNWETTKKATELSEGLKTRSCKKCGEIETKTVPQLKPSLPAITIVKPVAAKKAATIKWKKLSKKNQKKIGKIQVQYSTDKKFKKNVTNVYVNKSKASKRITKLASKKKYYIRVRSYKKKGSKINISKWSSVKAVKIK